MMNQANAKIINERVAKIKDLRKKVLAFNNNELGADPITLQVDIFMGLSMLIHPGFEEKLESSTPEINAQFRAMIVAQITEEGIEPIIPEIKEMPTELQRMIDDLESQESDD